MAKNSPAVNHDAEATQAVPVAVPAKPHHPVIPDPTCLSGTALEQKAEAVAQGKATGVVARTFVLAIMAGMLIAAGATFMLVVKGGSEGMSFAATQVLGGLCFSLGLICVIVAGAELFTGNSLMVCAALSGKITWKALTKNWAIVWIGNFVGSLIMVTLVYFAGTGSMNGGAVGDAMVAVAAGKIDLSAGAILCRGILCNFLVCLAVWMGFAGKSVVDKIFTSVFPVMAFVACGFEHCIANMYFLPMGLLAKSAGFGVAVANAATITWGGIFYNIAIATVGNIIGGAVLVGIIYWFSYRKKS